jgi:hypothetical protein
MSAQLTVLTAKETAGESMELMLSSTGSLQESTNTGYPADWAEEREETPEEIRRMKTTSKKSARS